MFSLLIFLSDLITGKGGWERGGGRCDALMLRRPSEGLEQDIWVGKLRDAVSGRVGVSM